MTAKKIAVPPLREKDSARKRGGKEGGVFALLFTRTTEAPGGGSGAKRVRSLIYKHHRGCSALTGEATRGARGLHRGVGRHDRARMYTRMAAQKADTNTHGSTTENGGGGKGPRI